MREEHSKQKNLFSGSNDNRFLKNDLKLQLRTKILSKNAVFVQTRTYIAYIHLHILNIFVISFELNVIRITINCSK